VISGHADCSIGDIEMAVIVVLLLVWSTLASTALPPVIRIGKFFVHFHPTNLKRGNFYRDIIDSMMRRFESSYFIYERNCGHVGWCLLLFLLTYGLASSAIQSEKLNGI
jgi:hypothetical protein